mmetsp:Transcript_38385/g.86506  ORF Transcript_38385/g.86506 Transcript_38385/m.86506 type:complete len:201 (+) Transcript_38385:731-1333(+)
MLSAQSAHDFYAEVLHIDRERRQLELLVDLEEVVHLRDDPDAVSLFLHGEDPVNPVVRHQPAEAILRHPVGLPVAVPGLGQLLEGRCLPHHLHSDLDPEGLLDSVEIEDPPHGHGHQHHNRPRTSFCSGRQLSLWISSWGWHLKLAAAAGLPQLGDVRAQVREGAGHLLEALGDVRLHLPAVLGDIHGAGATNGPPPGPA